MNNMKNIDKNQLEQLVKLQEIEMESLKLQNLLGSVDEKISKLDDRLKESEGMIEEEKSKLEDSKKRYHAFEADVQSNSEKMKKSEAKLSSVKTNKEYQSSLKEIEDLKSLNSQTEDRMLECLDQMEAAEKAIDLKQEEYKQLDDELCREKERIRDEKKEGEARLSQLEHDWTEVSKKLTPALLNMFNSVKARQSSGIAVAPAKNSVCLGCNMNIPPQMYNELQRLDSLKFCPYCQRILYWKAS
jgi:uncharacterized protein